MKIIDAFIFYNELDMLLYRLDTLYDYVDHFILVEGTYTHSGKEKNLFYNDNKYLFDKYNSKIIHIILYDFPFKFPNINYKNNEQWINEHYQRNSIKYGIDKLSDLLNDEDIIIVSDLDEIPDNNILINIKNNKLNIDNIYSLSQDMYYYNLNSKKINPWTLSKILTYKIYKNLNLSFQNIRHLNCNYINNGGWHLSYFGDKYFIKNKIENFGHQEFNNIKYTDLNKIEENINNQSDLYNRNDENEKIYKIPISENTYLPHNYLKFLNKYILY